jgi:glucose-1-phosphate cytidylyltransferase
MQVVILAGGLGTRIAEESDTRPKPMVEIGGRPILWHIMKIYSHYGFNDFIICLGYKSYVIKEFFANYLLHLSDVTIDIANNKVETHRHSAEPWRVTLVETGEGTQTGGRLKRVAPYIKGDFFMTYGDGVASVKIDELLKSHRASRCEATLTAVQPPGRFGVLQVENGKVAAFREKPSGDGALINGGFFVLSPSVIDRIDGDDTVWERGPLEGLAKDHQLSVFPHDGFWQPMDTLREKVLLERLWAEGRAPWKVWA